MLNGPKRMLKKPAEEKEDKVLTYREIADQKTRAALSPNLTVMIKAARYAARGLRRDFTEIEQIKNTTRSVEIFMKAAETRTLKLLQEDLIKVRPAYGLKEGETEYAFAVNALDCPENMMHGLPFFGLSIAVMKNGKAESGIIFLPILDELYYAETGKGSFMMTPRGALRLRVSERKTLDHALIGLNEPHVALNVKHKRKLGSPLMTLAYVAAGKFDGAILPELDPAGVLLVEEAGGRTLEKKEGMASNEKVFDSLSVFVA